MRLLFLTFLVLFSNFLIKGQSTVVVNSTTGYNVTVTLNPEKVNVPSSCEWGYSYTLDIGYDIKFAGSNIPSDLYTLQATITCDSKNISFDLPNNGGTGTATTSQESTEAHDCKTASVESLKCTTFNITIEGLGITHQTISTVVLPIELRYIELNKTDNSIFLRWSTESETNNSYFVVEKSKDYYNWEQLVKIDGAGNSNIINDYIFEDTKPYIGVSYYRITQFDYDGEKTSLPVKSINFNEIKKINVYPNPTNRFVSITGISKEELIGIYSINGINVLHNLSIDYNNNILNIDLSNLPAGFYCIKTIYSSENIIKN